MKTETPIRENTSRQTHQVVEQLLCRHPMKRVLDLPSGEGAFCQRMIRRGMEVYAGDCENLLKVPEARFVQCDMNRTLPFEDNYFDGLACIDGIEHLERPFDFVRECHRVLKPGGRVAISTPNLSSLRSRWRWLLTGCHNKGKSPLNEARPTPLHHIGLRSFTDLRYMLHTNGFCLETIACNRVKMVSWCYLPLVPISYLVTRRVFDREEKDDGQRARNREILGQLFTRAVLFGETLILEARKL